MGENFAESWHSDGCPPTLKKMIFRTALEEIIVRADAANKLIIYLKSSQLSGRLEGARLPPGTVPGLDQKTPGVLDLRGAVLDRGGAGGNDPDRAGPERAQGEDAEDGSEVRGRARQAQENKQ